MAKKAEEPIVIEEAAEDKAYWEEKVPYTFPLDRNNLDDIFISVNEKTYHIRRGVEVQIPRNVLEVWKQSEKADVEALMRQMKLSNDYDEDSKRYGVE